MTHTKQFIEDAIAGGWKEKSRPIITERVGGELAVLFGDGKTDGMVLAEILLDPLAWQAVGKTRGWETGNPVDNFDPYEETRANMHDFIDHLADGKDVEEALSAIT